MLKASSESAKNSFFVEGLGAGFFYSINYERLINKDFGLRVGAEYAPLQSTWSAFDDYVISCPILVNYMGLRSGSHALELGGGASVSYSAGKSLLAVEPGLEMYGLGVVGYRFQPTSEGFQFRIGVTTFLGKDVSHKLEDGDRNFLIWPHMSFGWSF